MSVDETDLKQRVHEYWNRESCGAGVATSRKHTKAYFDEIEAHRYAVEPEIFSFAQFTRARGLRVLEVGVGAGTDFIQWARSGAHATGVDLTREAVENARHRLDVYGLSADLHQADCERLPFEDDSFDLVYSWGVIHHTANTWQALDEIIRVCRPGGTCKVMIYNRHSTFALESWLFHCVLRGQPYRSLSWNLWHNQESLGTKGFTRTEVRARLAARAVDRPVVRSDPTRHSKQWPRKPVPFVLHGSAMILAAVLGYREPGFFLTMEFQKPTRL